MRIEEVRVYSKSVPVVDGRLQDVLKQREGTRQHIVEIVTDQKQSGWAVFPFQDRMVRLESVQNAVDQGIAVANVILGKPVAYEPVP